MFLYYLNKILLIYKYLFFYQKNKMENNDISINNIFMNPQNSFNKNLSPFKDYPLYPQNINREYLSNIRNQSFYNNNNNNLSCYATPKKDFGSFDQENFFSPYISNSKVEIINNNILTTIRKNSLNDISPFKPMINSPFINLKNVERK